MIIMIVIIIIIHEPNQWMKVCHKGAIACSYTILWIRLCRNPWQRWNQKLFVEYKKSERAIWPNRCRRVYVNPSELEGMTHVSRNSRTPRTWGSQSSWRRDSLILLRTYLATLKDETDNPSPLKLPPPAKTSMSWKRICVTGESLGEGKKRG